jgi:exopolysaccharide biosynthesis protein
MNLRRFSAIVAALVVLFLPAIPHGQAQVTRPYSGITYIDRVEAAPRPIHMHVAQIDLGTPGLRFKVSPPSGARETVRQRTVDFLRQEGAQIAINAHFFLPFPSTDTEAWAIGLAASEGRVFSAFETPEQSFAIVADAPALNIDSRNRARIVHRNPKRTDGQHVRERVTLWNVVAGSAQIVTDGRPTIPAYRDNEHPRALLTPGGPGSGYSNTRSWYGVATARTAVGLSRDRRTLTLFTVDVRGGSEGMRLDEVAAVLIGDYRVWNALNLDGGGSTTMAWKDPVTGDATVLNASSDNPDGRAVATSLLVFAPRR